MSKTNYEERVRAAEMAAELVTTSWGRTAILQKAIDLTDTTRKLSRDQQIETMLGLYNLMHHVSTDAVLGE